MHLAELLDRLDNQGEVLEDSVADPLLRGSKKNGMMDLKTNRSLGLNYSFAVLESGRPPSSAGSGCSTTQEKLKADSPTR